MEGVRQLGTGKVPFFLSQIVADAGVNKVFVAGIRIELCDMIVRRIFEDADKRASSPEII